MVKLFGTFFVVAALAFGVTDCVWAGASGDLLNDARALISNRLEFHKNALLELSSGTGHKEIEDYVIRLIFYHSGQRDALDIEGETSSSAASREDQEFLIETLVNLEKRYISYYSDFLLLFDPNGDLRILRSQLANQFSEIAEIINLIRTQMNLAPLQMKYAPTENPEELSQVILWSLYVQLQNTNAMLKITHATFAESLDNVFLGTEEKKLSFRTERFYLKEITRFLSRTLPQYTKDPFVNFRFRAEKIEGPDGKTYVSSTLSGPQTSEVEFFGHLQTILHRDLSLADSISSKLKTSFEHLIELREKIEEREDKIRKLLLFQAEKGIAPDSRMKNLLPMIDAWKRFEYFTTVDLLLLELRSTLRAYSEYTPFKAPENPLASENLVAPVTSGTKTDSDLDSFPPPVSELLKTSQSTPAVVASQDVTTDEASDTDDEVTPWIQEYAEELAETFKYYSDLKKKELHSRLKPPTAASTASPEKPDYKKIFRNARNRKNLDTIFTTKKWNYNELSVVVKLIPNAVLQRTGKQHGILILPDAEIRILSFHKKDLISPETVGMVRSAFEEAGISPARLY